MPVATVLQTFPKFIQPHCKDSSEFFRTHNFSEKGTVVWLDYTSAEDLNEQLNEFHGVVAKLDTYDVAKITLNASTLGLGQFSEIPEIQRAVKRRETLRARIPTFAPADLTDKDFQTKNYPTTLQRCVQNSLHDLSARNTELYFHPLSTFSYADGQTMLTITGMVFKASDDARVKQFIANSRLDKWPFANLEWTPPMSINMPALSAKERMKLDECLPIDEEAVKNPADHLKKHLGFVPGANDGELSNYAKYYRQYPHFSRVIL
ncbi:O-methyltransferase [Hydrogenophaga sp. A37]|uniref:O-methyltransferase n=1 Tax=Hydrogenophaga sp. A37 TaxID=1945864 RepID=UPI00269E69F5